MEFLRDLFAEPGQVFEAVRAALLILVGLVLARLAGRLTARVLEARLEKQQVLLFRRLASWAVTILFVIAALNQLGFDLGVLLGAAGIVSVAIGFASQTSASNLISGLFLIAEKPFAIGDVIKVDGTTGEVLSIDLLSVKLRTFNNRFIRIPNENMIKSEVTNFTKFPLRRVDMMIGVAYREDLEKVRAVLIETADKNLLCLDEPRPQFFVEGFGDSAVELQFSVWGIRENYTELKNSIHVEVKQAFEAAGIEIPFPQLSVQAGGSDAFPIELKSGDEQGS